MKNRKAWQTGQKEENIVGETYAGRMTRVVRTLAIIMQFRAYEIKVQEKTPSFPWYLRSPKGSMGEREQTVEIIQYLILEIVRTMVR